MTPEQKALLAIMEALEWQLGIRHGLEEMAFYEARERQYQKMKEAIEAFRNICGDAA